MEYGVGNGRRRPDYAYLAETLDAEGRDLIVLFGTKITSMSSMSACAGMWYSARL